MRIAILGIRGLPSTYGGFESFAGELAPRLVEKGHEVTVYCRKGLYPEKPPMYKGIRLVYLPSLEHKVLSTLTHSFFSIVHASLQSFDVILVVNAGNGLFGFVPRLLGKRAILNVDGMEWLRPKWNKYARWFFKFSARWGTRFYHEIVTDADEMQRLYAREFGIEGTYIAYGANLEHSTDPGILQQYGLEKNTYYLIASRLIPDNNADLIIQGFVQSGSTKKLVIAGGANYKGNQVEMEYLERLKKLSNSQVIFLGHIGQPRHVIELHCNAFGYIHGHEYGGINPALLKALGCGNLVLAHHTPFNAEVLNNGEYGLLWHKQPEALAATIQMAEANPRRVDELRTTARNRIAAVFTWERVTKQYEALFERVKKKA